MKTIYSILMVSLLFQSPAWSKEFQLKNSRISITVPNGWIDAIDLYGIPLSILGPILNNSRPAISITSTPLENIKFDDNFAESNGAYKKGREEFIKKHKGQIKEFFPHEKTKWSGVSEAHVFGYSYEIAGVIFIERTYYVSCKDRLFHLKSLLKDEQHTYGKIANEIVRGFKCL